MHKVLKKSLNTHFVRSFATQKMTVRDALNHALDQELARDENVFILGEEVAQYNGAYKVTKGLWDKYGDKRLWDTPITEMGFAGIAVGAGMSGLRPVCEFMTINFALQAIDHVVNSAAKTAHMSNGQISSPIVFRGPNGPPGAVGAQHSQCFGAWYASVPGLITMAPYDSEDAIGLLKTAIRDDNPVMFLENEIMYGIETDVNNEILHENFTIPIGKAKIMKEGSDLTIVSYARGVGLSLEAAKLLEEKGIKVEVINLRTLKPLDTDTIINSIKKTKRLLTVEEGWPQHGVGSEIISVVCESEAFDYLDAPPQRITSADVPIPYATNLEQEALPQADDIALIAEKLVARPHI